MGKKFRLVLPYLLFIIIELVLFATNYVPHTYLVGWDNVFPELNFNNALKINLFSVWQQYRGLGVQDGMAHAANLLHTCFLFLLSFILPQNILRYFFHFFMHFLGMAGMYVLLRKKFKKNAYFSLFGGLFYGLNLATIQMFYAPLEVFSTHFAAIPWGIFALLLFLEKPSKKNVLILFITHIIFTPQGFVPTVFIAYLIAVLCYCIGEIIHKKTWISVKVTVSVLMIILIANSFWLFPFISGALTQGVIIKNTKINQISSEEIYQKNIKRGDIANVLLLRGFMLDTIENGLNGKQIFIMEGWNKHINNPIVLSISCLTILAALFGALSILKNKKTSVERATLLLFLCSFLLLGTNIPIASTMNEVIRKYIPLFGEAFRFPFTKLVLIFVFAFTILLVQGLETCAHSVNKKIKIIVSPLPFVLIFIYALPVFLGLFFYPSIRLSIPKDYFDVISYFKSQPPNARIMTLPQSSFWNWLYYRWGERGSGFAWYGIEQPMLERPFDPWSNYNEQYFNEIVYALQTEDKVLFKNIINKYDISSILIDENIIQSSKIQQKDKLERFISVIYPESRLIQFNTLSVINLAPKPFIRTIAPASTQNNVLYEHTDALFSENGDYVYQKNGAVLYPFSSLFTNKTQSDISFDAKIQDDNKIALVDTKNVLTVDKNAPIELTLPSFTTHEKYVYARATIAKNVLTIQPIPISLQIGDQKVEFYSFQPEVITNNKIIKKCVINENSVDITKNVVLAIDLPNVIHYIYQDDSEKSFEMYPKLTSDLSQTINLKKGTYQVKVIFEYPQYDVLTNGSIATGFEEKIKLVCSEELRRGTSKVIRSKEELLLQSVNSSSCYDLFLPETSQRQGLFLLIESKNTSGLSLRFVLDNPQQKVNIIDTKLSEKNTENIIIVPPTSPYLYSGYGVHFRNVSLDDSLSQNSIQNIRVGTLPFNWLEAIMLSTNSITPALPNRRVSFEELNPAGYLVTNDGSNMIELSQSYNVGWKAYEMNGKPNWIQENAPFFFGTELKNHVLVNNWANGWLLRPYGATAPEGQTVIIVFWPQYLEFIGFGLLILTFVGILFL